MYEKRGVVRNIYNLAHNGGWFKTINVHRDPHTATENVNFEVLGRKSIIV